MTENGITKQRARRQSECETATAMAVIAQMYSAAIAIAVVTAVSVMMAVSVVVAVSVMIGVSIMARVAVTESGPMGSERTTASMPAASNV